MAVFHGGNLAAATQKFGYPDGGWLDLSTGINPDGYPIPDLDKDLWGRLPDQALLQDLKEAAAFYYGCSDSEMVIPVSGTQTLLQILPHLFEKQKKVCIVEPTYKEHEFCWKLAGHDVRSVPDVLSAGDDCDILIVVNPNNPTGDILAPDTLLEIARKQHDKGGLLIVDGAFLDCTPALELSHLVGETDGLLVLRSFGKFFGLAGIRLGFVLASGPLAQRLKDGIGPWAVNGPAMEVGCKAMRDVDWIKKTRAALIHSAQRLDQLMQDGGLEVLGGTSLFRFCQHKDAERIHNSLAEQGVLVRPFENLPDKLRFGLPGNEQQWAKLQKALEKL